jgi:hypothetical protein
MHEYSVPGFIGKRSGLTPRLSKHAQGMSGRHHAALSPHPQLHTAPPGPNRGSTRTILSHDTITTAERMAAFIRGG